MRIISGSKRGMKLVGFDNASIRPTTDYIKENCFNIIGSDIVGANFLDLFAGTGNVAIEASSRGAKMVIAVEKSSEALKIINQNKQKSNLPVEIVNNDAISFLKTTSKKFDLIYVDPPYEKINFYPEVAKIIFQNDLLSSQGYIVFESDFVLSLAGLAIEAQLINIHPYKYGKKHLTKV